MRRLFSLLAVFTLTALPVIGQGTKGSITGYVTDPSGAVVPGAVVTARNTLTGFTRVATSDQEGSYTILYLQIGTYDLTAEAKGFKKHERVGFGPLGIAQVARADIRLEVGALTERVEVTTPAPLIQFNTSETSHTVSSRELETLPVGLQRNPLALVKFLPGVDFMSSPGFTSGLNFGSITVANGGRWNQTNYEFDGGNFVTQYLGLGMAYPSQESIQEFKFISHSYNAEYGRNSSNVVIGVTKSGTNDIHGNAYIFHNDKSTNSRSFFNPKLGDTNQNDVGGSLGGPIVKDKLFYFGSVRFLRWHQTSFFPPYPAPSAANRAGDFSDLPTPIIDPDTGLPFPGNQIPQDRWDPVALNVMSYIPISERADNYIFPFAPAPILEDQVIGKVDYNLTQSDRFNVRFYWQRTDQKGGWAGQAPEFASQRVRSWTRDLNVHYTKNLSPNLLNEFLAQYRHVHSPMTMEQDFDLIDLGVDPSVGQEGVKQPPNFFVIPGFWIGGTGGSDEWGDLFQFKDTLNWIKGKHQLKMGVEYLLNYYTLHGGFLSNGAFTFDGHVTGNGYADFLIGRPQVYSRFSRDFVKYKNPSYYGFIQDDFKVSRSLTLNLGFRYEINSPATQVPINQQATYRAGAFSEVYPNAPMGLVYPSLAGKPGDVPDGLVLTPKHNIEPRFGFAWDPWGNGKTVIRGAYGLYSEVTYPSNVQLTRGNRPFNLRYSVVNPVGGTQNPYLGIDPKPFPFTPPDPADTSLQFPGLTAIAGVDEHWQDPRIQHINLTLEHQFSTNFAFEVAWVATLGHHLQWYNDLNPAMCPTMFGEPMPLDPDGSGRPYCRGDNVNQRRVIPVPADPALRDRTNSVTSIGVLSSDGNSNYHGLQMALKKRMSHGVMFNWNYTWSKAIDDTSNYLVAGVVSPNLGNRSSDRGISDWSHPHVTNLTAIADLPRFQRLHSVPRQIIGGWSVSGTFRAQSGDRVNIVTGLDDSLDGIGNDRPTYVGGSLYGAEGRPKSEWIKSYLNPAAFAFPSPGTYGNLGRNAVVGPGYWNVDLGLFKDIYLREAVKIQLRADFFNAFNHANFGNPFNIFAVTPVFGQITSAQGGRSIMLAARLTF